LDLGEAIVYSLAQSMKKLAETIHDCKIRPVARSSLALDENKVVKNFNVHQFLGQ